MKQIQHRRDIDALRGLSILLVAVYHAFPEILPGGLISVGVFFVILGYLITLIISCSIESNDFLLIKSRFQYADNDHFSKFGSIYIENYFQNEIFN